VNDVCALLLLFVEELWLWLRLKLRLWLVLHSAQKQGKRGEGIACSYSHTKGQTQRGPQRRRLVGAACTPHGPLHASQPRPLPLPFASSCSPLSCLSLCSFSRSRCWAVSLLAGDWGFKNRARGFTLARLEHVLKITFKTTIHNLIYHFKFNSGRAQRIARNFSFSDKKIYWIPKWSWIYGNIINECRKIRTFDGHLSFFLHFWLQFWT